MVNKKKSVKRRKTSNKGLSAHQVAALAFWNSKRGTKQKKYYSERFSEHWEDEETRRIQSSALKKAWTDEILRKRWSESIAKSTRSKSMQDKRKKTLKSCYSDPLYGSSRIANSLAGRPMSVPERRLDSIFKHLNLPYEFTGSGKVMIGRYCPDFTRSDIKSVIEMFGMSPQANHMGEENRKFDRKRSRYIKNQGYSILVVWQNELDNVEKVTSKILKFNSKAESKFLTTHSLR